MKKYELYLWIVSVIVVISSFVFSKGGDYLTLIASVIGVTALIFVAKGYVFGQVLTVVFAVFYAVISFYLKYYGEMITYVCMSAPMAIASVVSWVKNPYNRTGEVKVHRLTKKEVIFGFVLTFIVTVLFYFILRALGNANLSVSTLSVTTSFIASYFTYLRSPYYAIGYSANDIVLIVLWILASIEDIGYLPMVMCFVMFLVNDMYGFINWRRMEKRQGE